LSRLGSEDYYKHPTRLKGQPWLETVSVSLSNLDFCDPRR
jgi:hypothetical protein